MKAVIVGHGPSLLGEKMGELIDGHDIVIRLKRCQETLKMQEYYGTRTDIVGGSLTIAGQLRGIGGARRYWVWVDSRHADKDDFRAFHEHFSPYQLVIDKPLCDEWDEVYRGMRPNGIGHPHTSQGMKAILYACKHLRPDRLTLVGFDNILSGDFTWSVTRGPEWGQYPDHNWRVEHDMIPIVVDRFGVPIDFLIPDEAVDTRVQ